MSRSLMFSFTVIIFCLSINISNQVDAQYFEDSEGRRLFGWTAGDTPLSTDRFESVSDENINGTASQFLNPVENPEDQVNAGFFDDVVKKLSMLNFVWNTLVYSTIGFHNFLYHLGRPCGVGVPESQCMTWIPYSIGVPLSILVNFNHILLIVQYIRGYQLEN